MQHGFEHQSITLSCPGYDESVQSSLREYRWFKQDSDDDTVLESGNRVAYYQVINGNEQHNRTERDLKGRAWLDTSNGQLTIESLALSDEHWYTCFFTVTAKVFLYGKC